MNNKNACENFSFLVAVFRLLMNARYKINFKENKP